MTKKNNYKVFSVFLVIIFALASCKAIISISRFLLKNYRLSGHKNEFKKIDLIINYGYLEEINKKSSNGDTLLWWACYNNNFKLAKHLLSNGAAQSINCADNYGDTPLWWACFRNNLELTKYLIDSGAKKTINYIGDYGFTPVGWACKNNYTELVKYLIESGADTSKPNNFNWPPIYSACCNGNLKIVKYLVKNNAINNIFNNSLIIENNLPYISNLHNKACTKKFFSQLYYASWSNNIEFINFIFFGPNKNFINQKSYDKILFPSLCLATLSQSCDIIKYLIENYLD